MTTAEVSRPSLRVLKSLRWRLCTLFDVNFRPRDMSAAALRSGIYWLTERLYDPEAVERRRRPFFEGLWDEHERRWAASESATVPAFAALASSI